MILNLLSVAVSCAGACGYGLACARVFVSFCARVLVASSQFP